LFNAAASRGRFHDQQTQFGDSARLSHKEYRANPDTIAQRDPSAFPGRIVVGQESTGYPRDQGFKLVIEAVFLGVQGAMPFDDPADIPGLGVARDPIRRGVIRQQTRDRLHTADNCFLRGFRQRGQHRADFIARPLIERSERGATRIGQPRDILSLVRCGGRADQQPTLLESAEHAA